MMGLLYHTLLFLCKRIDHIGLYTFFVRQQFNELLVMQFLDITEFS